MVHTGGGGEGELRMHLRQVEYKKFLCVCISPLQLSFVKNFRVLRIPHASSSAVAFE
jgi:hypothetical protein